MSARDRMRGALLGLAVGDALGAAVEFSLPGTFVAVTGFRGGEPHGLGPGEWADDTSMALALADSIARAGWDLNDQARLYVSWWREGNYSVTGRCFDIGNTTRRALSEFEKTGLADTTGAVCGQLAGTLWGEAGIPQEWLDGLAGRQMLEQILKPLAGE